MVLQPMTGQMEATSCSSSRCFPWLLNYQPPQERRTILEAAQPFSRCRIDLLTQGPGKPWPTLGFMTELKLPAPWARRVGGMEMGTEKRGHQVPKNFCLCIHFPQIRPVISPFRNRSCSPFVKAALKVWTTKRISMDQLGSTKTLRWCQSRIGTTWKSSAFSVLLIPGKWTIVVQKWVNSQWCLYLEIPYPEDLCPPSLWLLKPPWERSW